MKSRDMLRRGMEGDRHFCFAIPSRIEIDFSLDLLCGFLIPVSF
jgi:hypothetical protein